MAEQVRIVITATDKTQQGVKSAEDQIKGLGENAQASLERIAIGAGVATAAIGAMSKSALEAYAEMDRNLRSLDAVERGFMGTTGTLAVKAKELQDQFFGLSATSGALRNLISSGLGADEAAKLIDVFKERAVLLGNASVPLEQRLINLSQAFKTEQSELGDASGLTENFSQIVARGSEIVGKNADEMTKAERAHAKYSAIVEMSQPFIGQSASLTESLTGKQAALTQEMTRTQQAVGEALAPAYQSLLSLLLPLAEGSRQIAEQNPNLVLGMTAMAGGAVAATTAVAGLTAALIAMRAAMGPIGLLVTAISAAAGAIGGLILATDGIKRKQEETRDQTIDLMRQYEGLRAVIDDNTTSTEQKQLATERLKGVLEQLWSLQPQMKGWFDEEGKLLDSATDKWDRYRQAVTKAKTVELTQSLSRDRKELGSLQKERAGVESKIRGEADPFTQALAAQARARGTKAEGEAAAQKVLGEAEAAVQDQVTMASAEIDAKIAVLEAKIEKDQALLDAINSPADAAELLKPAASSSTMVTGGSSKKADPFKDALAYMDHLKNMGQLTGQAEVAMLQDIGAKYAKEKEQEWEIEERISAAKKAMSDKETEDAQKRVDGRLKLLDHEIRMNQAGAKEEIQTMQDILANENLTDDQRMTLQERLADAQSRFAAESAGQAVKAQNDAAKTAEARVKAEIDRINHEQRMGQLSKEQEIAALQKLLTDEAVYYRDHADERWSIDERIYSLREDIRQADLQAEKKAAQDAAEARDKLERSALSELDKAQKTALSWFQEDAKRREDALQAQINLKEEQLRQLDREYQAEDRLQKIRDAEQRIRDLEKSGARADVIVGMGSNGPITESRIVGMDEAQKALADARQEDERVRRKEALQDEINNLRDSLEAQKESNREKEQALRDHFEQAKTALQDGFDKLNEAQGAKLEEMKSTLQDKLTENLGPWRTYANNVRAIIDEIGAPLSPTPVPHNPAASKTQNTIAQYATGVRLPGGTPRQAIVGEVGETIIPDQYVPHLAGMILENMSRIQMPTIPAALMGGMGGQAPVVVETLQLNLPNVTDARSFGRELPGALTAAGVKVNALRELRIGISEGQTSG